MDNLPDTTWIGDTRAPWNEYDDEREDEYDDWDDQVEPWERREDDWQC